MNQQFFKTLSSEDTDLDEFLQFFQNNNIDLFYKEDSFDLPTLFLLKSITFPKLNLKNFYDQNLFQKENSINIPYDILSLLCSIGKTSNYTLSNIKKTEKRLNDLFGKDTENSFTIFERQREYFQSLFIKMNSIDDIYGIKFSNFLKTNSFLYIYNIDNNNFTEFENKKYINYYLNDIKQILFHINTKEKFDNRSLKNLKYPISQIFNNFAFADLEQSAKNDYLSILLYYNHFSPSKNIQDKIKEILSLGQSISFEYVEHEKKLLKKIKNNHPDIFSLIEKSYLKNNLNNYDKNDILNKKRL